MKNLFISVLAFSWLALVGYANAYDKNIDKNKNAKVEQGSDRLYRSGVKLEPVEPSRGVASEQQTRPPRQYGLGLGIRF